MYHLGKKLARIDNGYQSQLLSFLSSSVCINSRKLFYRTDNSKCSQSQKQINYHKLASRFNCQRYLNSSFSNLELFLFLTPTFPPLSTTSVYSLLSSNTSPVTSDENRETSPLCYPFFCKYGLQVCDSSKACWSTTK